MAIKMGGVKMSKKIEAAIAADIESLKDQAAQTSSPCCSGVIAAFSDKRVRKIFLQKLAAGHVFTGIHCETSVIFEHVIVVINFRCADGIFCLIPPTYAATVNLITGEVVNIQDPYIPHVSGAQAAA